MRKQLIVGFLVATLIATALATSALAGSLPPGGTFLDDDLNIHEGAIEAIAAEGITLGCNPPLADEYCPDEFVRRKHMASFIARAESLTDTGTGDYFTDDDGSIHEDDIDRIRFADITFGCSEDGTLFCPDQFVRRDEMASFIARAEGLSDTGTGDYFTDIDGNIHEDNINKIAAAGITLGCNEGGTLFCPDDYVRRDEMASFLARANELTLMTPDPRVDVTLETVVSSGLVAPLFLTAPTGDDRLFILEKTGAVRLYKDDALLGTPFLDLADDNEMYVLGEGGLLGMAFHPDYDTNGRFFLSYTTAEDGDGCSPALMVIAEFEVSEGDPDIADAEPTEILSFCQPTSIHNGGMITFGPNGDLYIGLGDGGGAWDSNDNGQDIDTLLGSLLRINVDSGDPYSVPSDNPYVDAEGADEIFAIGFRNPWRFSIDGDNVYIADVGQYSREEVDVFSATDPGLNFGWPRYEGTLCVASSTSETTCDTGGMTFPILEYPAPGSDSITGGYVYRGSELGYVGHYFFGDYSDGYIKSVRIIDGVAYHEKDWTSTFGSQGGLASFGVDGHGELYIVNVNAGTVKKLVPDV